MIGRILDSVIGTFSPAAGARRAAARMRFEALSTYSAAERSRRNKDWNPQERLGRLGHPRRLRHGHARARVAAARQLGGPIDLPAFGRNVIGRGITPASVAKDADGKELARFQRAARHAVHATGPRRAKFCDIEKQADLLAQAEDGHRRDGRRRPALHRLVVRRRTRRRSACACRASSPSSSTSSAWSTPTPASRSAAASRSTTTARRSPTGSTTGRSTTTTASSRRASAEACSRSPSGSRPTASSTSSTRTARGRPTALAGSPRSCRRSATRRPWMTRSSSRPSWRPRSA